MALIAKTENPRHFVLMVRHSNLSNQDLHVYMLFILAGLLAIVLPLSIAEKSPSDMHRPAGAEFESNGSSRLQRTEENQST